MIIASSLKLNFRDLRVVDPSFRNESPVFLARKNAVVGKLKQFRLRRVNLLWIRKDCPF